MQPYMTSEQLERLSESFSEFSTHISKAASAFSRMAKCVWIYAEKNSKIKHLALHSKKYRVRKKNIKRLLKGQ